MFIENCKMTACRQVNQTITPVPDYCSVRHRCIVGNGAVTRSIGAPAGCGLRACCDLRSGSNNKPLMRSNFRRHGSSWLLPFCWRTTLESLIRVSSLPTGQKSKKMINFFAVYGCSSRSDREESKSFYRIPKIASLRA